LIDFYERQTELVPQPVVTIPVFTPAYTIITNDVHG